MSKQGNDPSSGLCHTGHSEDPESCKRSPRQTEGGHGGMGCCELKIN